MDHDPGSDNVYQERDRSVCDVCGSSVGVRLIEQRIRWGAAVRKGTGTGYTGRPIPWCEKCRRQRGSHSFKYSISTPPKEG